MNTPSINAIRHSIAREFPPPRGDAPNPVIELANRHWVDALRASAFGDDLMHDVYLSLVADGHATIARDVIGYLRKQCKTALNQADNIIERGRLFERSTREQT